MAACAEPERAPAPSRSGAGRREADPRIVLCDLPNPLPITAAELDGLERYLGTALARILGENGDRP